MKKIFLYSIALSMSFFALSCANDVELKPAPGRPSGSFFSASLINTEDPNNEISTLSKEKQSLDLKLSLPKMEDDYTPTAQTTGLENIVSNYAEYKKLKASDFSLLPANYYSITATEVGAGKMASDIKVELKDYENIPYGDFLLPVVFKVKDQTFVHLVKLTKEGEFSPLSETNKKEDKTGTSRTEPFKMIAFCETNDYDPRNFANVVLKDSKKPVFDIVVLFAANMNYNAIEGKRYLFFNDKFQPIVNNPETYIGYLKKRGIKVIVDILPNHQGVGYANFQSKEEAVEFAKDLKMWADKLGIDGYDIDEEYAEYNKLTSVLPIKNARQSYLWFCEAFKEVMPDKLLTLFEYDQYGYIQGTSSPHIDYSWANYGSVGSTWGVPAAKHAQYSLEANWDPNLSAIMSKINSNIQGRNLGLMFFNIHTNYLPTASLLSNLSRATQRLYGEDAVFEGKYFKGPKG